MTDKSAIVIPFGKHKGATVAELLAKDPAYAEWAVNQGWVAERFAELHAAILTRGAGSDDSPEHNAIQVRFLDHIFRVACLMAIAPGRIDIIKNNIRKRAIDYATKSFEDADNRLHYAKRPVPQSEDPDEIPFDIPVSRSEIDALEAKHNAAALSVRKAEHDPIAIATQVRFEQRGVDVVIDHAIDYHPNADMCDRPIKIEIKPTMGDDFPTVMRQMQQLGATVLVLGEYTGRAVSEPQLRQMFQANGHTLLFVRDIEAEIANARAQHQTLQI